MCPISVSTLASNDENTETIFLANVDIFEKHSFSLKLMTKLNFVQLLFGINICGKSVVKKNVKRHLRQFKQHNMFYFPAQKLRKKYTGTYVNEI